MKVHGLMRPAIELALAEANKAWDGNLKFNRCDAKMLPRAGARAIVTITVRDSHAKGGKLSFNLGKERHVHAACWHAYRDFIRALFNQGARRVTTMMADYTSLDDFESKYPATGYRNVGSAMYPVQASETCNCGY